MSNFTYTTRKDGRLMKKVTIKGRSKPIYLYSKDKDDLEKQYIETMYLNNVNMLTEDIKFKDFAERWLDLNSVGKEYQTINEYKFLLKNHINPNIGYMKLKSIKIYDIKQIMKNMESIPTTAKKTLQLIKRILNDAVDNDIIIKNVAQNLKAPKITKNERFPLTLEEDNILLSSNNKYAPFFILMRYTGMRKEEIVPLTVDDIDFDTNTISINKAVTFVHNQPVLKSTKNRRTRYVPILDNIKDLVHSLVDNAGKNKLLFIKEKDSQMLTDVAIRRHLDSFLNSINKKLKEDFEKEQENKKKQNIEIDEEETAPTLKFTCHQLRHSYCTMLYYAGVKIKKAQELMGHSSADMVYNIYTHLDEKRENAEELINNYIKKLSN